MNDHSELLSTSLGVVFPIIIIFGIYLTLNGHVSPGGGFQGGAMLATVFICKYLVLPIKDQRLSVFKIIEKVVMVLILLIPISFFYLQSPWVKEVFGPYYFQGMNILIGIKVACGLSILFFRFVFYETR